MAGGHIVEEPQQDIHLSVYFDNIVCHLPLMDGVIQTVDKARPTSITSAFYRQRVSSHRQSIVRGGFDTRQTTIRIIPTDYEMRACKE